MTVSSFSSLASWAPLHTTSYSAESLTQLRAALVLSARICAADEVNAAIAHQLNDPLTALLLYMREIQERCGDASTAEIPIIKEMADKALRDVERVCSIIDRMGSALPVAADAESAVTYGSEAIEWLAQNNDARAGSRVQAPLPSANRRMLTPREREVLALITHGTSNKEGGRQLGISTRTFEVHRAHIMGKLGAKNAADLVRMALSEIN